MIQGNTLFLGDSITVGLAGLVAVNGEKGSLAEGGKTSGWLLSKVRALPDLRSYRNAFVLIGTNDIGGDASADAIYANVREVYRLLSEAGIKVYGATVPPFRGYEGYASRYDTIEAKRRRLNEILSLSPDVYRLIRLDRLMADPNDPSTLAAAYDGGDHLHPRKDALARLLEHEMGGSPSLPQPTASGSSAGTLIALALGLGGGYALYRLMKRPLRARLFT